MRSIIMALALIVSFGFQSAAQAAEPVENLYQQLKDTTWAGQFHFEVYRMGFGGPKRVHTSIRYNIEVAFNSDITSLGQIPYFFAKDVSKAEGFDKFAFDKIDAPACPNEPRMIQVTEEKDNVFAGIVHAPSCKDGKRTIKQLPIESMYRDGKVLKIVIADNAIGEAVTFRIVYTLYKTSK